MKWNKKDIDDVLEFIRIGKSYKEISEITRRTEGSIRSQSFRFDEKTSKYYKSKEIEIKCGECGIKFIDFLYKGRKFCSQSCNAKFNNRNRYGLSTKIENDSCMFCNIKTDNTKYCSRDCQTKYERNLIFEKIENGDISLYEKNYKKYLIYKYGEKCMECGWCEVNKKTGKIPVQMEHIDGHSTNNSLNNLKLLCPNCHSLTPTYGSLNKGNGRKKRYNNN